MTGQERKSLNKFYSDFSSQIATIDTRMEERWENHNKSAGERARCIEKKFDKIFAWLEKLPCESRVEATKSLKVAVGALWGIVIIFIGAIVRHWICG